MNKPQAHTIIYQHQYHPNDDILGGFSILVAFIVLGLVYSFFSIIIGDSFIGLTIARLIFLLIALWGLYVGYRLLFDKNFLHYLKLEGKKITLVSLNKQEDDHIIDLEKEPRTIIVYDNKDFKTGKRYNLTLQLEGNIELNIIEGERKKPLAFAKKIAQFYSIEVIENEII